MKKEYTTTWKLKTEVSNRIYSGEDFSGTNFNSPIFKNTSFENCFFSNCKLDDTRIYDCNFTDCTFSKIDLRGLSIGAHGGIYLNCNFDGCDLRRRSFFSPEFINTTFSRCKLKAMEPQGSYFENCKFIGKLEDITFYEHFENDYIKPRKKELFHSVDFSDAIFGDFVSFEDCDLSRSTPPAGKSFEELLSPGSATRVGGRLLTTGELFRPA